MIVQNSLASVGTRSPSSTFIEPSAPMISIDAEVKNSESSFTPGYGSQHLMLVPDRGSNLALVKESPRTLNRHNASKREIGFVSLQTWRVSASVSHFAETSSFKENGIQSLNFATGLGQNRLSCTQAFTIC